MECYNEPIILPAFKLKISAPLEDWSGPETEETFKSWRFISLAAEIFIVNMKTQNMIMKRGEITAELYKSM